jgi:hypothetical protein
MEKTMNGFTQTILVTTALAASLALTGCSGLTTASPSGPIAIANASLTGKAYGGQQPIAGASIYLYAAGTTGYSAANTNILTSPVLTDSNGSFSVPPFNCNAGQQMYLVALGGNPGHGTNAQSALMAALGDCSNLGSIGFIQMNEVTTVGSVFALSPFMSGYSTLGSSSTNTAGLARAFASVNKLINITTGLTPGPALAAGATAPISEIYTLADVIAACVNSNGGVAGDSSTCGNLLNLVTPSGGSAPTDTIGLTLAIAQHPTLQTGAIFLYATPLSPFVPRLNVAPSDWTMSINYTGFNAPKSTTIDASGNLWIANSGNNTVTELTQTGAVSRTLNGNGLTAPNWIAIDSSGNAWIANSGGTTVSVFTSSGGVFGSSPFTAGTAPNSIAIDAPGNIWVANGGSNNVSELSSSGSALQQVSTGSAAPSALAVNPK